jgi:hypothetical protein
VEEYSDSDDEEYIIQDELKLIKQFQTPVTKPKIPMRLPFRLENSHDKILTYIDPGASKSIVSEDLC